MSESDGPKRRRKKGEDPQPEPVSQGESPSQSAPPEKTSAEKTPAHNPWHSPAEESAQRRSARMDDILRQRSARVRSPFRMGGNGMLGLAALGVVSAWLLSTSLHVLAPNERGIVTTLGRYTGTLGAGLNLTLPWPIQQVTVHETGREQVLMLPDKEAETLMLTRDGELIDVRSLVRWRISDLAAYSFARGDADAALRRLADSAIRAGVAEFTFDELRSGKRQAELQQRVVGRLQRVLDAWKAGITVNAIEVTSTNPPARLAETFKKIDKANEDARKNHEAAVAYAARIRYAAETEANSFDKAYQLYKIAPAVTRERIYYETIERVLRNNQVVIGNAGTGVTLPPPPGEKPAPQGGQ